MFRRDINLIKSNSFFVFGARGTGKSTLIRRWLAEDEPLEIDLLDPVQAEEATLGLPELTARIQHAVTEGRWVFVDEVQKAPKLLDVAQSLIDKQNARFVFTGSSARKLRRGAANLLAGRAYTFHLHPLISTELDEKFDLETHLRFGGLPHVWNRDSDEDRVLFLRSYITTYLKEEIAEEQIVRKLDPFAKFLQVAAQTSGLILNYSNLAKDVGVSDQTVKTYFQILEDTLLGFLLPAFDRSIRKAQGKSAKFFLFDTGVLRALQRNVDQPLPPTHFAYGQHFEHFVISEIRRRAEYLGRQYNFSFIRTNTGDEVDLVIDRPGHPTALVEIKSTDQLRQQHTKVLKRFLDDFPDGEFFILSRDDAPKQFGRIHCYPWNMGITKVLRD